MFSAFTLHKLRSEDSDARRSALGRLTSLDKANVLDEVVRMMVEDKNGSVRTEAEKAIQRTKPAGAGERLKDLLHHNDPESRYSAARVLQEIGWIPETPEQKAELLVGLRKCDLAAKEGKAALEALTLEVTSARSNRQLALDALVTIGGPGLPHLLAIVRDPKLSASWVAQSVAKSAENVGDVFFVEALKDPNLDAEPLCDALAKRPMREATTMLIDALSGILHDSGKNAKVRRAAAIALANSGNDLAVKALRKTLRHDPRADTGLRSEVTRLLGESKNISVVPDLIAVLAEDASERVVRNAYYSDSVREQAACALGKLGDPAAKEVLVSAINDPDKLVALAAVKSLGWLNMPPPIERLVDLLQSVRESEVRRL